MQVTQVSADGLKHHLKVVVPAADIETQVTQRLDSLAKTARLPGFRPGKAPVSLLRKQYGRSVVGEILEKSIDAGSKQAIADHQLRPALQPKVEVTSFDDGKDLEFELHVENLPTPPEVDLAAIQLTRYEAEVAPEVIQKALDDIVKGNRPYAEPAEPRPARADDRVTIDFAGKIDDVPFDGGTGKDMPVVIGSGMLVPGFEDQLIGTSVGDEKVISVTFPEDYGAENLRGKAATFDIKVNKIEEPGEVVVDDEFAKKLGQESVEKLNDAIRQRFAQEYGRATRMKLKRALLDVLAESHQFEVPPGMVEIEFEAIWRQLTAEMQRMGQTFADEGKSEDEAKEEYRRIAERRVRLGLLLSDIGTKNEIKVENKELQQAMIAQAQRFPGQARQVFEFYQKNPSALEQLRAPIFEDKVVDFIIDKAAVTTTTVTPDELMKEADDEDDEPMTSAGVQEDAAAS
ncbi:MAG TPA: trigger factor [Geminicoccus sp.]|jgi:trigger factor|uniref:trigger factor n=1 Tax=Geminicoccus sp. TaxID=2024832 RepID=UPI002E31576D|nr:trigger factor [Geminicoccus sp.]HEX2529683.1 trigger factor [Geminicoccus sp.]